MVLLAQFFQETAYNTIPKEYSMRQYLRSVATAALCAFGSAAAHAEPLKIAVIEAFSGPNAQTAIPFV
ncbi:hypothetical protein ABTD62_22740, partial [Acinetobacter baumannii]